MAMQNIDATERVIEIARAVLAASANEFATIDFDDMLYMTLKHGAPLQSYDNVVIDEAQDTNGVQRALLHRMVKRDGRLIAVGDRAQAIYGFRGADSDAMDQMCSEFSAVELPLDISYRCPKAVVRAAQEFVPHIHAADNAIEGKVETLGRFEATRFTDNDAVLCRNTAPLVSLAYKLITKKIAVRILGREVGAGLVALVKKMRATSLSNLSEKLAKFEDREVAKLLGRKRESAAQAITDKCASIQAFIDGMDADATVDNLISEIKKLFGQDNTNQPMLTLATVHKSKGKEWNTVYILDRDLMPSRWARQAWQQQQENNLIYVAYTRAMENLYFIQSDYIE